MIIKLLDFVNHYNSLINLIIYIILIAIFKNYIPSYLKQKGTNLAQKEDIAEITNKVEEIKQQYIHQQEKIKAELGIIISQKNAINNEARKIAIKLYDKCILLIGDKFQMKIDKVLVNFEQYVQFIIEYQKSVLDLFSDIYIYHYRLYIFFNENSEIVQTSTAVLMSSIALKELFLKHFGEFRTQILEEIWVVNKMPNDIDYYKEVAKKTDLAGKKYHDAINDAFIDLKNKIEKYQKALNRYLSENNFKIT